MKWRITDLFQVLYKPADIVFLVSYSRTDPYEPVLADDQTDAELQSVEMSFALFDKWWEYFNQNALWKLKQSRYIVQYDKKNLSELVMRGTGNLLMSSS